MRKNDDDNDRWWHEDGPPEPDNPEIKGGGVITFILIWIAICSAGTLALVLWIAYFLVLK